MATTPNPLVWDYYREVPGADALGGVAHFYTEEAQSLYLSNGGISTQLTEVPEGHWSDSVWESELDVTQDDFTKLRLDHPSNGTLYGVATDGSSLTFLRYAYSMNLSSIVESFEWTSQIDNPITQLSMNIQNIGADIFGDVASLFNPGARLPISVRFGDAAPYPIAVSWLDEAGYSVTGEEVELSGRNTIGYFLRDQTFDSDLKTTGTSTEQVEYILNYAGVKKYEVQPGTSTREFVFKPDQTIMSGLQDMGEIYSLYNPGYQAMELPDGTVIVGYEWWRSQKQANSYYTFEANKEVFVRKSRKMSDAAYTALRASGKDANDNDLTPVLVPVNAFTYWNLGPHRTKHVTAPNVMTQEELQTWAESQALALQYTGITENFTGPFRPQLLVGDIAEVTDGDVGVSLGIITEVRHTFSRKNGFRTEFSVDSGGIETDGDDYVIYSRAASVDGFNRKQRIADLIKLISVK